LVYTPERIGMLSMLCLVVTFGAHSLVDWTWYVPGDACVALLCAGWLAGRGPLHSAANGHAAGAGIAPPRGRAPAAASWRRPAPLRACLAGAVVVAALLAAWSQWQPQRSEEARAQALTLLARDPGAALAAAQRAVARDPLSVEALFALSTVQQSRGETGDARWTLERAVRLQPSNPQTWMTLGRYQLTSDPAAAARDLQAAIYLDPESISKEAILDGNLEAIEVNNDYIQALEAAERLRSASGSR
jgi:cytochrome c-type biogenesis protein CcmH/NrfG